MKNIFYAILIFSLLNSCKSNTKQETKDTTAAKSDTKQIKDFIQKFKPIIQGVWIKKNYIDEITKTKSPLAAIDEAHSMTTMYIDTEHIKGDSIMVPVGWGNHDGSQLPLKFVASKGLPIIMLGSAELSYSIEKGDTILFRLEFDEQKKKTIIAKYIRVLKKQPHDDLGYGLALTVNKELIAGQYILTDTTGSNSKINFTEKGDVFGFFKYKKYWINIDLKSDRMDNLDEIGFDYGQKNHISYSYKINADTLNLYETHPNSDSSELILGKRVYKLVRQK